MEKLIIRDAREADVQEITEILNTEIRAGTASWKTRERSQAEMVAWLSKRRTAGLPMIVAEGRGQVLGYASYGAFRPGAGYGCTVEHSVYVARDARRRGVGRLLLAALLEWARAVGYTRMVGGISADQTASLALHRAFGFEEQGRLRGVGRKHRRMLDLVFMVRALDH